jgi:hypothetical protein
MKTIYEDYGWPLEALIITQGAGYIDTIGATCADANGNVLNGLTVDISIVPPTVSTAEVQTITISDAATATGTYTLSFGLISTISLQTSSTTAEAMQDALCALGTIGLDGVTVSRTASGDDFTFTVTFQKVPGDVPLIVVDSSSIGGSAAAVVAQTTQGISASSGKLNYVKMNTPGKQCAELDEDCVTATYSNGDIITITSGNGTATGFVPGTIEFRPLPLNEQSGDIYDAIYEYGCKCHPGFYGPDCSRKLCPSGMDPYGGYGAERGRECSGRGICDPISGECECFMGFTGSRCENPVAEKMKLTIEEVVDAEALAEEANTLPNSIAKISKKKKPILDRYGRLVKSADGRRTRMADTNRFGRSIVTHMGVEVEEEDEETEALFAEADRAREAATAAKKRAAKNIVPDI